MRISDLVEKGERSRRRKWERNNQDIDLSHSRRQAPAINSHLGHAANIEDTDLQAEDLSQERGGIRNSRFGPQALVKKGTARKAS